MSVTAIASTTKAPTEFVRGRNETYAYRRFGSGPGRPLLFLQHFTGTLDNWDPAVTDSLASGREVILFDNAGIGRSSGTVPQTIAGMAEHVLAFADALRLTEVFLAEHLPNAMLLTYPDAGHGSLFQFHESFVKQASLFLDSEVF